MYRNRAQSPEQKTESLRQRQLRRLPLHEPPHFHREEGWFLITAATYRREQYFRTDEERMWLWGELLKELQDAKIAIGSWVVLPDHYHLLVECRPLSIISQPLRRVHARTARELNRREGTSKRKVWHLFTDRQIRSERHYYTTLNYIHYNPTKHSYVQTPLSWACSSLHWYQASFGIDWVRDLWQSYPVRNYGKGWDW